MVWFADKLWTERFIMQWPLNKETFDLPLLENHYAVLYLVHLRKYLGVYDKAKPSQATIGKPFKWDQSLWKLQRRRQVILFFYTHDVISAACRLPPAARSPLPAYLSPHPCNWQKWFNLRGIPLVECSTKFNISYYLSLSAQMKRCPKRGNKY